MPAVVSVAQPVLAKAEVVITTGQDPGAWRVVTDGVMGGESDSRVEEATDNTLVFRGELSLRNGGGFAGARLPVPRATAASAALMRYVRLRVRGDGRTYQLRFRCDVDVPQASYVHEFATTRGIWTEHELALGNFMPRHRGRALTGLPSLRLAGVTQVGLMIADGKPGPFALELEYVAAVRRA